MGTGYQMIQIRASQTLPALLVTGNYQWTIFHVNLALLGATALLQCHME